MESTEGRNGPKTIKSVFTTFDILEWLQENRAGTITEIAEGVGVSTSTVHHHLTTLEDRKYVERTDEGYELSVRFLTFGGLARERKRVYRIGRETIDTLAAETGETARLVVDVDGYGITLYQSTGENVDTPRTHLGTRETLHSTAAGKAILAYLPDERVAEILDRIGMERWTERTITDRDALVDELEEIRSKGIAFDDREHYEDMRCIAHPIVQDEEILGAVSITAPADRRSTEWFHDEASNRLFNATGVIRIESTYSTWLE